jgi:nicotinate-nucleotide pyrophosphorylase (carboxylating)
MLSPDETAAASRLIQLALAEDLGTQGDVTSRITIPEARSAAARVVARADGVVAGLPVASLVAAAVDPRLVFEPQVEDGSVVRSGQHLARLAGPMRQVLSAERTLLNFLQYLSGIATLTRRFTQAVAGLSARILDTRKTLPGYRLLAKYAVRCGGGTNHRLGLHDGILIKDNHLAAAGAGLAAVIRQARQGAGGLPVEVEVDTLDQFDEALPLRPDIILLDNMPVDWMREAVRRRDALAPGVLLEASGGVTLATVRAIAESGVDRISVGVLTHSVPALDIALDYETA